MSKFQMRQIMSCDRALALFETIWRCLFPEHFKFYQIVNHHLFSFHVLLCTRERAQCSGLTSILNSKKVLDKFIVHYSKSKRVINVGEFWLFWSQGLDPAPTAGFHSSVTIRNFKIIHYKIFNAIKNLK